MGELYVQSGSGGTPAASNPAYYGGDVPFLSIADIESKDITSTQKTLTKLGLKNSTAWVVPAGAISLAMYASVGKVGIIRQNTATSQAFFNMVFVSNALRDFVYYRLEKAEEDSEWEPYISTGTQRNLNAEKVQDWALQVPSEDEMRVIGSLLDSLDNLITLHQRKQENVWHQNGAWNGLTNPLVFRTPLAASSPSCTPTVARMDVTGGAGKAARDPSRWLRLSSVPRGMPPRPNLPNVLSLCGGCPAHLGVTDLSRGAMPRRLNVRVSDGELEALDRASAEMSCSPVFLCTLRVN